MTNSIRTKSISLGQALAIVIPLIAMIFGAWIRMEVSMAHAEAGITLNQSQIQRVEEENDKSDVTIQKSLDDIKVEYRAINKSLNDIKVDLQNKQDRD